MGAPKWMQDVADRFVPDISGRGKAAAAAKQEAEERKKAAAAEKAAAEKAAAEAAVKEIRFKKGGSIDGIAQRGKTRGRAY